jgi:hypothetical protein
MLSPQIAPRQGGGGPGVPSTPEKDIEDNTAQLLAVVGTLYGLALLAVLLRVWVRTRILKAFGMLAIWHFDLSRKTRAHQYHRSGRLAHDDSNSMHTQIFVHAFRNRTDHFCDIAPQYGMPCLHCLLDTSRSRKARRNPAVSSSMGATNVRMAVLLLNLRHPRVQLHQALHCCFLASSDAAD